MTQEVEILYDLYPARLQEKCNKLLAAGWQLRGSMLLMDGELLVQMMVRARPKPSLQAAYDAAKEGR